MKKINDVQALSVPAVDRTLDIFEYLIKAGNGTVKEISSTCGIPPASASRILKTLAKRGYVTEQKNNGYSFSLGLKFLQFYQVVYSSLDLDIIAKEEIQTLANRTNQASQLAILSADSVMYTQTAFPKSPIAIIAPLRTPIPINISACGKILCAFLPDTERVEMVKRSELLQATPQSITDKLNFLQILTQIRRNGYATDFQEFSEGIGCVAAPVFDHTGKVIAAIGITGNYSNYSNIKTFEELKTEVIRSAQSISRKLGKA